jgi:hypothetical protein
LCPAYNDSAHRDDETAINRTDKSGGQRPPEKFGYKVDFLESKKRKICNKHLVHYRLSVVNKELLMIISVAEFSPQFVC